MAASVDNLDLNTNCSLSNIFFYLCVPIVIYIKPLQKLSKTKLGVRWVSNRLYYFYLIFYTVVLSQNILKVVG